MSNKKETVSERLARLQREKEEAKDASVESTDLVSQLTHENDGATDFAKIAQRLQERKAMETKGENENFVKMTIYIREDIAKSFDALCIQRGDQKRYANQALAEFVERKVRELGLDK